MQIQKDITIADCDERVSVVYTEEKFGTKDTAIAIYDKYRISILMSDGLNAVMGDTVIKGERNSVLFFRPDELHFGRISRADRHSFVDFLIPLGFIEKFKENVFEFLTDRSENRVNCIVFDAQIQKTISDIVTEVVEILKTGCKNENTKLFSLVLRIVLLCADFYEVQKNDSAKAQIPYVVRKTMNYISENFSAKLSLKGLAEESNCSVAYISRVFKLYTGMTIYTYITNIRMANAQIMLNNGATVTEACFASGFGDCSNFIRTFKKATGRTPLQFGRK